MSRIARFAVLVTALASLFAVMSSTAGAVTWHNTGNTAFTATGGAGTLAVTGSGGTNNLTCTGSRATGTAPGGSTVATIYSVSGTVTFSPCTLAGNATYVHCGFTLTGTSQPSTGVTSGNADVSCVARLTTGNTALCNINGTTPGHYTNPGTAGKVTLTSSASLVVTNASGSTCSGLLGTSTSGAGHLSEQTITVTGGTGGTGTGGPIVTRTA